ncbi:unnamed protein product, partial [Owenia fusiformis]
LPAYATMFSIIVLLIGIHHVYESEAVAALAVLKGIFYLTSAATISISITNFASEGCAFYPQICSLKDKIKVKEPQVEAIAAGLKDDAALLREMDGVNTALYNTLNSANVKNERIVGKLEMIRDYSADIVQLLETVAGIEVTNIDPDQMDTDVNAIQTNIISVQSSIKSLEEQMKQYKYIHGAFLAIEILPKAIYFANNRYKWYQNKKMMTGLDTTNFQRAKIQKLQTAQAQTGGRLGALNTYLKSHPKVATGLKVAAYGMGFLMNGAVLYFEFSTMEQTRDSFQAIVDQMDDIIESAAETREVLEASLDTEEEAAIDLGANYIQIKEGFVNSSAFMNEIKTYSGDYYSQSITDLPSYTDENINDENIIASQDEYIDWLIEQEEHLQSLFDRLSALKLIEQMLAIEAYQTPIYSLVAVGQSHDTTLTRETVIQLIADTKTNVNVWPDFTETFQFIMVDLTAYRD